MELYVVGQINPDNHLEWELQGVFDDIVRAEAICIDDNYFIGPIELNQVISVATTDWINAYYPRGS